MSSTSDQTTQQSKTRLIVGEIGVDTETGIIGKGHSYDNGKTFTVDDTIYGRIYHADDHGKIWKGIQDKVKTVVEPAKSAADSAVRAADDAVASAQVTSDAVSAIASATAEAKQGANDAMSRAKSAWDVATGAKEAVTDFDPLLKSAQSDASKALTQIADTTSALSDAKTALTSDVAAAKNLAITAQTTANSAVESAGENAKELASQANALSDAKKAIDSDVASAKGLANAAQATADNAIKSASSVANDLSVVASQAKSNANEITKVTSDVGLLQTTVANNTGDISTIQETAKQIQQSVSDNAGNITVAKQTADSAVAVASDAKSNATVAIQTASQASITASNASGQAASAVLTAQGAITTANNANSNATVAIQTASGASLTATNANSDATIAKQTASEAKIQASNAESDFAQLSVRANKIETNVANNSGAIANVQQTANGLTTTVADIISNGGGRNLAIGTDQEYAMGYGIPNTTWQDGYAYEKLPTTVINGEILPQDPHSFAYTMTQGTTYTQTVWFETDATVKNLSAAQITWFAIGLGHDWQPAIIQKLGQNSYKIVSTYTWPGKTSNYVRLFDIGALNSAFDLSTGTYLKFGKLMLENGTVAHDWSPAPEDAQNQFTQIKQSIDGVTTTINDPKTGLNATYQTAAGNATTISNAQGDIAKLKTRADGFDAQFADTNGNISKLQADASGTKQTLANTKSDVAVLQSRADGLDAKYADAAGDINTLKANASGFSQTLVSVKGDISTLQSTATGLKNTLTDAQGNISTLQSDVSGLKKTTSDNAGNISTLQSTANTLTSQMSSAQGDISTLKQTTSGISSQVSGMSGDLNNLKSQAQWLIVYDTVDLNNIKTPCHEFLKGGVTNGPNETAWWYLTVEGSEDDRITQTVIADQSNNRYTRRFADSWSAWVRDATQTDVTTLSNLIAANTTAIEQNKNAITLKADQTNVDTLKGTVNQLQSSLTVQAGQIQTKVSASDVSGMLTGYATQEYTQSLVTQKADDWNVNLTKLKNDTQTSFTNLSATVDGIQAEVYNKDGSSKITQLSNLIATKVSQGDYNSQITQLKNDINLRVAKGDVISQINQEAGGNTLIQVSNGKGSLILNADNTIITGKAWIPDAAISSISADKIMLGSSALWNSDGTLNLVNQSNGLKALMQVKQGLVQNTTQSIISFASDYNTRAFSITPVGATVTPTLFFERYDQTAGHWLGFSRNEVQREGLTFNTWDNDGERFFVSCHARFNKNITAEGIIMQGTWNGTTGKPKAGIFSIESGNTIWSGSGFLAVGDHLSNSYTNVIAKSFSQQSTLSSKTNIETVDPKDALNLVNRTDIRSYQYKTDVEQGKTKRYTSLIIDDVNDVSQYYAPNEFTNEEQTGRDDGSAVGYLFLAVKELTRRIEILEDKLNG